MLVVRMINDICDRLERATSSSPNHTRFWSKNNKTIKNLIREVTMSTGKPTRKQVQPTDLNIWSLHDVLMKTPDGRIRRMEATSVPHVRRTIAAGWLEPVQGEPRGVWQLSETGRAGIEAWRRKESSYRSIAPLPAWWN